MPGRHQPKYLPDGDRNPLYKTRRSGPGGSRGRHGSRGADVARAWGARFIGWDGEGLRPSTPDSPQPYALMMNSEGGERWRARGLRTEECLRFLCDVAEEHPGAIHGVFGGSYDFNQILRDVPRDRLVDLWTGLPIMQGDFEVELRMRKSLTVRRFGRPRFLRVLIKGKKEWRPNVVSRLVLWDVWGFFQGTFLDALAKYMNDAELRELDYDRIVKGKARRSQFRASEREAIRAYTAAELRALVALMRRLREHLREADLAPARWDGAGAIAAALLRREGVKAHMAELEPEVERAAQHAYAGGRMEVARYGAHSGRVFHADINSAYPAAMVELPCLRHGRWTHLERDRLLVEPFTMYRVEWSLAMAGELELFPFFYREAHGDICYPPEGHGWYWGPELELASRHLSAGTYTGRIRVREAWHLSRECDHQPFAFVPELYERRRRWKEEGRGAEKVLKLGYNSLYGKLAQQLGYGTAEGRRPPYHNLAWAGFITARTRATLLAAALEDPASVVMLATDALYATRERDLAAGPGLGEWDVKRHSGIVVAQSGVYWTRDAFGGWAEHEAEFRRGFDKDSLSSERVVAAWRRRAHVMKAKATRFVGIGSALADGEPTFRTWRTWRTTPRDLRLDPAGTKREPLERAGWGRYPPHKRLVPTRARTLPAPDLISTPYPLSWRGEDWVVAKVDGVDERTFETELYDSEV